MTQEIRMPNTMSEAIFQLVGAHRNVVSRKIRQLGIYPGQEQILMQIRDHGEQSQNTIKEALAIDHSTVAKSVARLAATGLVQKQQSDADKRISLVALTDEGQEICHSMDTIWNEVESVATAGLTADERAAFLVLARQITQNLTDASS